MTTRREKLRTRFVPEALEGRVALSGIGGIDEGGTHRHRGRHAEVQVLRHGADDPANHHANDDKGGRRARGKVSDDPANHDANDDKGGTRADVPGNDDPANHDANDDKGGRRARAKANDDPANHDANDDKGGVNPETTHRHRRGRGRLASGFHARSRTGHAAGHR